MPEFLNSKFKTSEEMCDDILNKCGVALLPGSDFGFKSNQMLARLSFTDFDGEIIKSGRLTVFHNGILVQNNVEILGTTEYIGPPKNEITDFPKKALKIQDHGNFVSYRNIWYRKL